ncbi:MAG: DUF92 domain-containing protein [Candidatus Micrarchaeia archaeon]
MTFLTLDKKGVIMGLLLAAAFLIVGGNLGVFFIAVMLYFLIASAIVTHAGTDNKKSMHLYQKSRGVKNVLANGIPPLTFAALFGLEKSFGSSHVLAIASIVGFMASIAAVTADKFSSELGVLDGTPRSIITGKEVKKGVSGGVTGLGLASGLAGSMLMSLSLLALPFGYGVNVPAVMAIVVILAGFSGTIIDSYLGYFEEKGIGTKYTTNFLCGIGGGIVGLLLYLLVV